MAPLVELSAGPGRLLICPEVGGALVRYRWHGMDVLRPTPDDAVEGRKVRLMGCYPLVPYSNRIGQARLITPAGPLALRPNFPPEPHAIHGVGWQRPWRVAQADRSAALLVLEHAPDADWPFAFEARQRLELEENGLLISLSLTNRDTGPMPAGLGLHPFFPIRPGLHLQSRWQGMWEMGEDKLPSRKVAPPPEADFGELRPVADWKIDNVFTGWERQALLDYGRWSLKLNASPSLAYVVCFAPRDGRNFVAIEPVSHVIDAFAMAARGVPDTGARLLAAGETMAGDLRLQLSGQPA